METKEVFTQIFIWKWFGSGIHRFEGQMMNEGALMSFTLYNAHRRFAPHAQ